MHKFIIITLLIFSISAVNAETITTGNYYVTANSLNVRLSPQSDGKISNKIYRQQKVNVFEIKLGWARISKYYDGSTEGISGQVARWISKKYLTKKRPQDREQLTLKTDPRINGLPKVGQYGATKRDVYILYAAAHHYLKTGLCKNVEYGDKSASKKGVYYLNCGGPKNLFFKPSHIPGIK